VSRGVTVAGWQYRARVTVSAPATAVADRIGPYAGAVTAVDDRTCVLDTGADSLSTVAAYLGLLGFDFRVESPPNWPTKSARSLPATCAPVPRGQPPPRDSATGTGIT